MLEGDTYTSIAEEYLGDARKVVLIERENPDIDPTRLAIGQKIRLPAQDAVMPSTPGGPSGGAKGSGSPGASGSSGSPGSSGTAGAGSSDLAPTSSAAGRYTIRQGDTLASIADRYYGTKSEAHWRRIYEANKVAIGQDPARLKVGLTLVIPPKSS